MTKKIITLLSLSMLAGVKPVGAASLAIPKDVHVSGAANAALAGISRDFQRATLDTFKPAAEEKSSVRSADIKTALSQTLLSFQGRPRSASGEQWVTQFEKFLQTGVVADPLPAGAVAVDPFARIHQEFFASNYNQAISDYTRTLHSGVGTPAQRRQAMIGLGECYLAIGAFEEGFKLRDARLDKDAGLNVDKLWDGKTDLNGKTLLIRPEGGFGDIAFFQLRLVPIVQKMFPGCKIVLEGNFPQQSIYKLLPGVNIVKPGTCQDYDHALYGMSLPRYFSVGFFKADACFKPVTSVASIPAQPYIVANPALVEKWQTLLQTQYVDKGKLPIAIFWEASANAGGVFREYNRNIDPKLLIDTLSSMPNLALFNLQGPGSEAVVKANPALINFEDFDKAAGPFQDTVAFFQALKNVNGLAVGIDTGALNFAGGVGVKTFALLPEYSDWRWGTNQIQSEWFPSLTLIRQAKQGDWSNVMTELKEYVEEALNL